MIIDVHGHYTTAPKALENWRNQQIAGIQDAALMPKVSDLKISDDELRETIELNQLAKMRERGSDLTQLLVGFRQHIAQFDDRARRTDAGHDVFALCVGQELTVECVLAGGGVAAHSRLSLLHDQLDHAGNDELSPALQLLLAARRQLYEQLPHLRPLSPELLGEMREELRLAHPARLSHRVPLGWSARRPAKTARPRAEAE